MTMQNNFSLVDGVCLGGVWGGKQLKIVIISLKTADISLSNTCHTEPLTFDD